MTITNKMKSVSLSTQKMQLATILLAYMFFASIFGFAYRYAINPDGISIIRLATYIAEGNFQHSISSSWSPLMSWLIAPFLYFGFDGLTAARIVIALSGVGLIIGSWFLASRFDISHNSKFIALLITALLTADWTIRNLGADILIAALLVWYLYIVTDSDILRQKTIPFLAGIVGGVAFLSKNYALPFFIVHFPLILLLRYYFDKKKNGNLRKGLLVSLIFGITGLLIISSIWISILSVRYGQFTISSKGKAAHSTMGPKDMDRSHPAFYAGLHKPNNNYSIHVFEDPSGLEYKTWSPFESKEYFLHELELIKINIDYILKHFIYESPFFTRTLIVIVLSLVPLAFFLSPMNNDKRYMYLWTIMSFSIYSSGYILLIARSPRRFYAFMIVFVFLSVHFMGELINGLKAVISERRMKLLRLYIMAIIILAFTIKPGMHLINSLENVLTGSQVNPYKEIAEQIETVKFPAPYAIIRSSQKPHTDLYIAYFLRKQFLGRPLSIDVEGITRELKAASAGSLIIFDNPETVDKFIKDKRYIHAGSLILENNEKTLNSINAKIDQITDWDKEVNIFQLLSSQQKHKGAKL